MKNQGHEIAHDPAADGLLLVILQVPKGFEFDKLPLTLGDEPFQFHFAKEFFHRGPSATAIPFVDWP